MKKTLCWMLVCLVCLVCLAPVLGMASESYFPWLAQKVTLRLDWAAEVDAQQQGWTPDAGYRMVQLHFTIMDGPQLTEEVNANAGVITLVVNGERYEAAVLQMPGVQFDAATGTFSTDETQSEFDLLFMVPEDAELASMELQAPHEEEGAFFNITLGDVPLNPEEDAQ